jgi:chromate transporter
MLIGTSFLDSLKKSTAFKAVLQGIRPAVVGMIIAAAFVVGRTIPHHWASAVILAVALIAIIRFRIEVALVIPVAGIAGLVLY